MQQQQKKTKSEKEILYETHRFLRNDDDNDNGEGYSKSSSLSWEERIAIKYYQRLFKEFALIDLSRVARTGQIAMRWRTESEVRKGKGQFICASLNPTCEIRESLSSWELLFGYVEGGKKKQALVKVRLCESCSQLLNENHKSSANIRSKGEEKKCGVERERESSSGDAPAETPPAGKSMRKKPLASDFINDDGDEEEGDGEEPFKDLLF